MHKANIAKKLLRIAEELIEGSRLRKRDSNRAKFSSVKTAELGVYRRR
jgi:hypothetical protein